jgi:hypothetical protein
MVEEEMGDARLVEGARGLVDAERRRSARERLRADALGEHDIHH